MINPKVQSNRKPRLTRGGRDANPIIDRRRRGPRRASAVFTSMNAHWCESAQPALRICTIFGVSDSSFFVREYLRWPPQGDGIDIILRLIEAFSMIEKVFLEATFSHGHRLGFQSGSEFS